jgi:hypothetical protein
VLKDQQKGQALMACLFCCEPGSAQIGAAEFLLASDPTLR